MAVTVVEIHLAGADGSPWVAAVEDFLADREDAGEIEVYDDADRIGAEHVFYLTGAPVDRLLGVAASAAQLPGVPRGAFALVTDDRAAAGKGRRVPLT
jgi:hypothetical protein